jgi:dTDP-4-dehydrorhamnose reductase
VKEINKSRRLLVLGSGFIGGNLCTLAARRGWEVHSGDSRAGNPGHGVRTHLVDITDEAAVRALFGEIHPTAVVDLAAVADIDRAERERDLAWAVNVEAARTIASCCAQSGSAFVYFSSDAVFAGTADSYGEDDNQNPVNWYGKTKVAGEKAVRGACPEAGIVRLSLALGFPVDAAGNSFFAALEKKLSEGREIPCPAEEIRTPVDVITLSECVLEIIDLRYAGALHIGSTDSIDRLTLTRRIAARMGYPAAPVVKQEESRPDSGRAARHRNGIIRVAKAQRLLRTRLLSVDGSIQRAFEERM